MNEDFVQYKECVELRNLNFKLLFPFGVYTEIQGVTLKRLNGDSPIINTSPAYTIAPTYSQAFKFFRDNYKLVSWVYQSDNDKYHHAILRDGRYLLASKNVYASYEEAELECLRRLINIVKE